MKFSVTRIVAAFAIAVWSICGVANADTIAGWTFESSVPTTGGPHAAEVGAGLATGVHASGSTVYSNPVGNGSAESFSSNFWAIGDYYQFSVSTVGFEDITIGWAQTSSSTGPGEFDLQYRVGGVGAFTSHANYVVLPNQAGSPGLGTWNGTTEITGYNYFFDLSSIIALNNASTVEFRLNMRTTNDATPPGTVATTGTSRVDNIFISGSAIPEPATAGFALLMMAGVAGLRRRS